MMLGVCTEQSLDVLVVLSGLCAHMCVLGCGGGGNKEICKVSNLHAW